MQPNIQRVSPVAKPPPAAMLPSAPGGPMIPYPGRGAAAPAMVQLELVAPHVAIAIAPVPPPVPPAPDDIDEADALCPLTLCPMYNPFLDTNGHHWERWAIVEHFMRSGCIDPLTQLPLTGRLVADPTLRERIARHPVLGPQAVLPPDVWLEHSDAGDTTPIDTTDYPIVRLPPRMPPLPHRNSLVSQCPIFRGSPRTVHIKCVLCMGFCAVAAGLVTMFGVLAAATRGDGSLDN